MMLASQLAQQQGHSFVTPEYLLLAIARENTGVAAAVLRQFEITPGDGDLGLQTPAEGGVARTPKLDEACAVLVYANEECEKLGQDYIGTEHLLLGILRVEHGE